jgi:hypothetical protein
MWPRPTAEFEERWRHDLLLTWEQFNEAGVAVTEIDE